MDSNMVTITNQEYTELLKEADWLSYLRYAGVDNSDEWSYAQERWEEDEREEYWENYDNSLS